MALVAAVFEHGPHRDGRIDQERAARIRTHDGKGLSARRLGDLLLFAFVDAAGFFVQFDQVLNVVRRQREDKAVLAGVDDGRRFSGDLLGSHEVLDVLRDDDLHTVVFTDALRQLEHEVQRDREFGIDEDVRFVDDDHDLPVQAVARVVIAVLDDLVVDVFKHEQHLRVCDGRVAVREHRLEVEHGEVLVGGDGARTVPDVGVAAARGEFRHVVHQRAQHRAQVLVIRALEFLENRLVQVVEHRIIGRPEFAQVGLRRDALVGVDAIHHVVQVFQRVFVAVGKDLFEELLQELQVGRVAPARGALALLVVVDGGDDVEGIEPSVLRVSDVDEFAVQILRQFGILVFGVQDEDLRVFRSQVDQQRFRRVGLTGTGLTDDDHVAVDPLAVAAEEIDEHGHAAVFAELDAAFVGDVSEDPGEAGCDRIARDAAAFLPHRVERAYLGSQESLHLPEFHIIEFETGFLPAAAHRLFHVANGRQQRWRRLGDGHVVSGGGDIVRRNVDVALQQDFVVALERRQQFLQRVQVGLDLDPLGVDACSGPLSSQFHEAAVDAADGLLAVHLADFDHDLGTGHAHDAGEPRVAHHHRIAHDAEVVRDDMVDLDPADLDVHGVGLRPFRVILGSDVLHFVFVEVELVRVFQKDSQVGALQAAHSQFALREAHDGVLEHHFKLFLVALEQRQIEERLHDFVFVAEAFDLVEAVVRDLYADLVFVLGKQSALEGSAQLLDLFAFSLEIFVIIDRAFDLDDVGRVFPV